MARKVKLNIERLLIGIKKKPKEIKMDKKEVAKKVKKLLKGIQQEIADLMYKEPTCDFEHAWNCALDKATECLDGYEEE